MIDEWKKRGLYCFDELPKDASIGGTKNAGHFNEIELTFAPCNLSIEK